MNIFVQLEGRPVRYVKCVLGLAALPCSATDPIVTTGVQFAPSWSVRLSHHVRAGEPVQTS